MGYVPNDVKWFIAEIVEEITVEGDPRNVVHVNYNLIRADSPEEAYNKALELGRGGETQYENSEGKQVSVRFRGLRNLRVVYDELEHGAELMFEESIGMSSLDLQKMLKPKEELETFIPWQPPDFSKQPDYGSKEIIEEVERRFGTRRFGGMDK
jgi:hypothetical protein